jgi:hypothetical protein
MRRLPMRLERLRRLCRLRGLLLDLGTLPPLLDGKNFPATLTDTHHNLVLLDSANTIFVRSATRAETNAADGALVSSQLYQQASALELDDGALATPRIIVSQW